MERKILFAVIAAWSYSVALSADHRELHQGRVVSKTSNDGTKRSLLEEYAFRRDVIKRAEERTKSLQQQGRRLSGPPMRHEGMSPEYLSSMLMKKAVPLEEYNANIVTNGGKPIDWGGDLDGTKLPPFMSVETETSPYRLPRHNHRRLEDGGDDADDDGNGQGDDYYMDPNYMHDFDGYSLKFATCHKVQRFSSTAIANGEYSALITDDIVILRLCPQRRCNEDYQFGCWSGYGEYAIDVNDYLRIMILYEMDKQKNFCGFCLACSYGTEDDYSGYSKYNGRQLDGDDYYAGDDGAGDDYYAATNDDDATNDDYNDDSSGACDEYADECYGFGNWCVFNDDDDDEEESGDDDNINIVDYIDFFDCVQVEGNDQYDYWISPRCDPYSASIRMGIFYDPYCSQYAGNDVNLNDVSDFDFQSDIFEEFYAGTCVSCGKNYYPPYYNANNNMCNALYRKSGKCNTYLAVDLDQNDDDDGAYNDQSEATCSFIESIREGTYDASGQVDVRDSFSSSRDAVVTATQKVFLVVSSIFCVILALYSCYLHHEITNLLLKSLAHGHLIPGLKKNSSRTRSRSATRDHSSSDESSKRRKSRSRSKTSRSRRRARDGDDWDHRAGEYA